LSQCPVFTHTRPRLRASRLSFNETTNAARRICSSESRAPRSPAANCRISKLRMAKKKPAPAMNWPGPAGASERLATRLIRGSKDNSAG
jgi:hypothetical protein